VLLQFACVSAAINTAMLTAGVLKALALAFIPTKDLRHYTG
jgi:hypothetical protein